MELKIFPKHLLKIQLTGRQAVKQAFWSVAIILLWMFMAPNGWCGKVWIGFGDSITQGYPYITDPGYGRRVGGYEPDLEALIPAFGGYPMVLNFGLASETTAHGVNRLSSVLASVTAHSILILEGTNDIWEGISLETTLFNLNQMIEKSRSSGLRPIIATLTPDERDGVKDLKQIPETYNPAIRQLARDQKIPLADLYAAVIDNWANLVSEDGLHPNAEGYQTIAQKWFMAMLQRRGP
jgi:lysophospholipase L1-like esterase